MNMLSLKIKGKGRVVTKELQRKYISFVIYCSVLRFEYIILVYDIKIVIEYESVDIIFFCSNLRLFTYLQ